MRGSRARGGNTGLHWVESWLCSLWGCLLSCKGTMLTPPSFGLLEDWTFSSALFCLTPEPWGRPWLSPGPRGYPGAFILSASRGLPPLPLTSRLRVAQASS